MSSVAQINANRANAQYSTGPATQSGLDNCKFNALRHGLCSQQIVIKGEDPAAYDALRAGLVAEWNPSNELEAMLVEQMSQNWWRLERARRIETKMMDQLGEVEAYSNKAYLALQRQMNTTERAWNRAIRDLQKLRVLSAEDKKEAQRNAIARSFIASRPKIGSVSANPLKAAPVPAPAPQNQPSAPANTGNAAR